MQVVLVMFRGEGERRSFSIVRDVTVIGRREDCDFRIPLGEISRKHCRLIKDGDTLRAEDLGSSNGTYINGMRVQEAELSPGDTLKVGSVVFVVQIDGVPSEENLHPAAPAVPESAMEAPPDEHALLNPTAQADAAHAAEHANDMSLEPSDEAGDEAGEALTVDEPTADEVGDEPGDERPREEALSAESAGQYDPMSILEADPESSSMGSMLDDGAIAEDLIIEMESHDQPKHNA